MLLSLTSLLGVTSSHISTASFAHTHAQSLYEQRLSWVLNVLFKLPQLCALMCILLCSRICPQCPCAACERCGLAARVVSTAALAPVLTAPIGQLASESSMSKPVRNIRPSTSYEPLACHGWCIEGEKEDHNIVCKSSKCQACTFCASNSNSHASGVRMPPRPIHGPREPQRLFER